MTTSTLLPIEKLAAAAPTTLTRDELERIVRTWQERMQLDHWRITVDPETATVEEAEAEYDASDWYDEATIRFSKDWRTWDRRKANLCVVHELAHLLHRDADQAAGSAKLLLPKPAHAMFEARVLHETEAHVEHLAQILVTLGGVV